MEKKKAKQVKSARNGSALIMTVVLTVLLSIVAVMFVAMARMDVASTSNIADNKMLDSAAKTIVNKISRELVLDTPGVAGQEYYDYPDVNNPWLASIEPYKSGTDYYWRQISDVTGYLAGEGFSVHHVDTRPTGLSTTVYVPDYPVIKVDPNGRPDGGTPNYGVSADADGDGIADSKWIELENLRSSKGESIYAAIRIIDNGGMVNINTAHTFDAASSDVNRIDGSSQMQINLKGMLKGGDSINTLHNERLGTAPLPQTWADYEGKVIWQYGILDSNYVPFSMFDEFELRCRYCIDSKFISRFEVNQPYTAEGAGTRNFGNLYQDKTNWRISDWQDRITNPYDPNTDRRHMLTTLNCDRVIDPNGDKIVNVNTESDPNKLYYAIRRGLLDAGHSDANVAAQIAANIIDYRDTDSIVTDFNNPDNDTHYYGFERPCIYISEIAYIQDSSGNKSYAIELYKPYPDVVNSADWKLTCDTSGTYDLKQAWPADKHFYIIKSDASVPFNVDLSDSVVQDEFIVFDNGTGFSLRRTGLFTVDSKQLAGIWPPSGDGTYSFQRDITQAKCIRRLWDTGDSGAPTLGLPNKSFPDDGIYIQAHPKNLPFTNIGEIGMILCKDAYEVNPPKILSGTPPADVFVNLADPNYQQIFKYLTVMDPANPPYSHPNTEKRIKGRININTAPAFVIAQLPWVSLRVGYDNDSLSQAIVAYRDKMAISGGPNFSARLGAEGFGNIGQLCNVVNSNPDFSIDYYIDTADQIVYPDLDPNDGAPDDFEERDLIFSRISDLVTVRSDVFTAYILVRIGTNGPQRRFMALLDRSEVPIDRNGQPNNRVEIIFFQAVPGAR
jgi:hypothetical protein